MSAQYQRTSNVTESLVGSKRILYHPIHKKAVVLNATGSWVWAQLDQPATLDGLVSRLHKEYPSSPADQLRQDLQVYLDELLQQEVVKLHTGT